MKMGKINTTIKENLNKAITLMQSVNDTDVEEVIREWKEASGDFWSVLEDSEKLLKSRIFSKTLEFHNIDLERQIDFLQDSLEERNEELQWDALVILSDSLYTISENVVDILEKVKEEINNYETSYERTLVSESQGVSYSIDYFEDEQNKEMSLLDSYLKEQTPLVTQEYPIFLFDNSVYNLDMLDSSLYTDEKTIQCA